MVYSRAWGKLIHEKKRSKKSRDTVPLSFPFYKPPESWLSFPEICEFFIDVEMFSF